MVGLLICALYGTDLKSAIYGIVIGNVVGFGLLGILDPGPKYSAPQMVVARSRSAPTATPHQPRWRSWRASAGSRSTRSSARTRSDRSPASVFREPGRDVVASNRLGGVRLQPDASSSASRCGCSRPAFVAPGRHVLKANFGVAFDPHAPIAIGGALAGFIYATALAFSYATGWIPAAADYSRYLPSSSDPRKVWWYSFLGCAVPCIVLEIVGAATVSAVPRVDLSQAIPTDAIAILLGNGLVAKLVLATVVLGTLTANCMNLYSARSRRWSHSA